MHGGKKNWAQGAVRDFIDAANPLEWRLPALNFAAGKISEKEMLDEVEKLKDGGSSRICEAYFTIAMSKNEEDESRRLKETLKHCPPYSLERMTAEYKLRQLKKIK